VEMSQSSPACTLINHPNNKLIQWNESSHTFTVERFGILEGITKVLSTQIYPNYDDKYAWTNRDRTHEEKMAKERRDATNSRGREFGKEMHKNTHQWVQCNTRKVKRPFNEFCSKPHCYIRKLFGFLKHQNLVPIDSEFSIWDGSLKLATKIDLIAEDSLTGLLVPIELKFGFNGFGLVSNGNMQPPCQLWPNNAVNQWQIQLLVQTSMLIQNYAIPLSHMRPRVVWIHDNGVHAHELSPATIGVCSSVMQKLKNRTMRASFTHMNIPRAPVSSSTPAPVIDPDIMELLNSVAPQSRAHVSSKTQSQSQSQPYDDSLVQELD